MKTLAIFHSTIRTDEKLIIQAARKKGVRIKLVDIRNEIFNPNSYKADFDIAINRSVSTIKGQYATKFLESIGATVVNSSSINNICEDKFLTSLKLSHANISTPRFALVFNAEKALVAIKNLGGFPVVVKPALGSWGRLLAKINDLDSLEAIIEHKEFLGSAQQKAYYFQEYVKKPGRDIRVFVIDNKPICAIYRNSNHWITNTARGGKAINCPINKDLLIISSQASAAIGGGILALDIFETNQDYSVNEINHTMEFKNSEDVTGVSISGLIVDYCLKQI